MSKHSSSAPTDNELIICRCEGVRVKQIRKSIRHSGVKTINQIKKLTRAGMGPCQGRTCARLVETILATEGKTTFGTEPYRSRPPVRGISLGTLAAESDQFDEPPGPVTVVMTRTPEQHASTQPEKKDQTG